MSAMRAVSSEPAAEEVYVVRVTWDPTEPWLMGRWEAKVTRQRDGYPVAMRSGRFSRKRAEKAALRYIRNVDGSRSYSFTVTRSEATS